MAVSGRRYRIKKVSELTGVPATLLRAWEDRHGVVSPKRQPSGYRAYSEADVALLTRVKALVDDGLPIGDVVPMLPSLRREVDAELVPRASVASGTAVERWRSLLLEAALEGAQPRVEAVLDEAFAALTPVAAYEAVLAPVLVEVGERWLQGTLTVAEEHLISFAMRARLFSLVRRPLPGARGHVLCACLPDEEHDLGLLGAALRFAQGGWRVTYLGARTPVDAVVGLAQRLGADVVALSAVNGLSAATLSRTLSQVRAGLPRRARLLVGGRAAEAHPEAVARSGATLVLADAWAKILK
jgi:DNA-binding transcriptional MerR regulator/methylmalonyl-CoA mutase cobalamin-binding subunit